MAHFQKIRETKEEKNYEEERRAHAHASVCTYAHSHKPTRAYTEPRRGRDQQRLIAAANMSHTLPLSRTHTLTKSYTAP